MASEMARGSRSDQFPARTGDTGATRGQWQRLSGMTCDALDQQAAAFAAAVGGDL